MPTKFPRSKKAQKDRMDKVLDILSNLYPDVKIQLDHSNPFELTIATILSAQCTDERVNKVTKELFKKYKIPEDYLSVPLEQLEQDVFSTGYYKAKAKNIRAMCEMLIKEFNSKIPSNMDDLLKLPGVGRKTANVVLGHAFDIPGIVVDTHVSRITNLLGFINSKNAVKIEYKLMELIDEDQWVIFTHYFINHGRNTCIARRPQCGDCKVSHLCPSSLS